MSIDSLDHFQVNAADLDATRDFYTQVLGMRVGPRPPFDFPGYWLYVGDRACVHLAGRSRAGEGAAGGAALDHVAFATSDLAGMRAKLRERGIQVRERTVPGRAMTQLFVSDPNGVTIELNFSQPSDHGGG